MKSCRVVLLELQPRIFFGMYCRLVLLRKNLIGDSRRQRNMKRDRGMAKLRVTLTWSLAM